MVRGDDSDSDAAAGPPTSSDPRRIEALAVTESDVVDALEAAARSDRNTVLRVTPPFSGRMRARIHDAGAVATDGDDHRSGYDPAATAAGDDRGGGPTGSGGGASDAADASPIHLPPERFVADPPAYPTVDDTEDELRASSTPYTRARHRERHQAAVESWRERVREQLVDSVTLDPDDQETTVSVSYLG